jgi:hypothetical protein
MKHKKLLALPLLVVAVLALFVRVYADDSDKDKLGPYKQIATIAIPGGLTSFDISWVDSEAGRYYLADKGNAKAVPPVPPRIDVIDTEHDKYLYSITGFVGPNGVVAIRKSTEDGEGEGADGATELWVGDTDSTAKVVDLKTKSVVASIPTHTLTLGTGRADELAYDPIDHIILIANDRDNPPFVSFLSTKTRAELGYITYPQAVFLDPAPKLVNHGLEQPVWNGLTKRFYLAVPATSANHNGEIDEIDPITKTIKRVFPTSCNPAGLALIPGQRLMTSCGDVINIATGLLVPPRIAGVSGDEIWFNPGDERVYFGGFTSVAVVSALSPYSSFGTLPWVGSFVPPPALSHFSHSIAADSENNHIFLPVTNTGVLVFTDDPDNGEGPDN